MRGLWIENLVPQARGVGSASAARPPRVQVGLSSERARFRKNWLMMALGSSEVL
jgi:hypothetical protein